MYLSYLVCHTHKGWLLSHFVCLWCVCMFRKATVRYFYISTNKYADSLKNCYFIILRLQFIISLCVSQMEVTTTASIFASQCAGCAMLPVTIVVWSNSYDCHQGLLTWAQRFVHTTEHHLRYNRRDRGLNQDSTLWYDRMVHIRLHGLYVTKLGTVHECLPSELQ